MVRRLYNTTRQTPSLVSGMASGSVSITLVKPMLSQKEDAHNVPSVQPRPKFGVLTAAPAEPLVYSAPPVTTEHSEELSASEEPASSLEARVPAEWESEAPQSWDYKFAAALVALLIVVNTGLIFILHQDKGTQSVVETSHVAPSVQSSVRPISAKAPVAQPAAIPAHAAAPAPSSPAAAQDLLSILTKQ